jgi:hypothetical protein
MRNPSIFRLPDSFSPYGHLFTKPCESSDVVTTLLDAVAYTTEAIADLYH